MDNNQFQSLLDKYLANQISAEEMSVLMEAVHTGAFDGLVKDAILQVLREEDPRHTWAAQRQEAVFREITEHISPKKTASIWRSWWAAAAVLVIMAGAGWLWWAEQPGPHTAKSEQTAFADIPPGGEGAVLTLANGDKVVLDSLGNGMIADQHGVRTMLANGQLSYEKGHTGNDLLATQYNTISTPGGRQFSVVLPDGSKVWLNALSSLRFPVAFTGGERKVEVTGEAYFEIAQNASLPFRVAIRNETEIRVLGTSFNVSAYENESHIRATLVTGKVNISHGGDILQLSPGQQARIKGGIQLVKNVDVEQVTAWKNGAFNFNDVTMEDAMRQLERWYEIEVVYDKNITDIPFSGKISRKTSLKNLLKLMEGTSLEFRLEQGRRLVVTKQE